MAVYDEEIRRQIEEAASRPLQETEQLVAAIVDRHWPGGVEDRTEPAALAWLREWSPTVLGVRLPACSCPTGPCSVCN